VSPEEAVALACAAFDLDPRHAAVLRAGDHITVALDADHVARVIPAPTDDDRRALAAALLLPRLVQRLDDPVERDGALVVAYPRVAPGLDGIADLAPTGASLSAHHAQGRLLLREGAVDLPAFDPLRLAERWLERAPDVLDAAARSALLGAVDERWALVDGEPAVLHADAHPANWFADDAGPWLMIDPEYLAIGPAVYDLAPLEVVERRLGAGPSRFASFRAGYEAPAGPVDDAALAAAIGARELLSVAWLAARAADARTADRVRARLDDALAGRPGRWHG
jgi:antitoxin (DNA-binding transcriptional repressor) of toxin-antitoxin stability system